MFKNPFSFEGRIRRTEYGLSIIIGTTALLPVEYIKIIYGINAVYWLFLIPFYWFMWAQGAKRCHDRGNSGWYQVIPFYGLWMIFAVGDQGENQYGADPKVPLSSEIEIDAYAYKNYLESSQSQEVSATGQDLLPVLHRLHRYIAEEKRSALGTNKRKIILSILDEICKSKEEALYLLDSYYNLFNKSLIDDLCKLNSSYNAIKENVQVFIDLGIVSSEYPHRNV